GAGAGRGDGAAQRVGQRVEQDGTIIVPAQTFVVRECHAADFQGNPSFELVGIPSITDSHPETPATDSHGFPRIFFLSLSKSSLRNWRRVPKLSNRPNSISVAFR